MRVNPAAPGWSHFRVPRDVYNDQFTASRELTPEGFRTFCDDSFLRLARVDANFRQQLETEINLRRSRADREATELKREVQQAKRAINLQRSHAERFQRILDLAMATDPLPPQPTFESKPAPPAPPQIGPRLYGSDPIPTLAQRLWLET